MNWGATPAKLADRLTVIARGWMADGPAERADRARRALLQAIVKRQPATLNEVAAALGRGAPADYDYPATRAALKGHQELASDVSFVEFSREGRRYFGARVPDFEVGKKLAKLVKTKVAGSTPELVCHDPAVQRTLSIDLATGELTK